MTLADTNNKELVFKSLADEEYREYVYPNGTTIKVSGKSLHVSKSGGHRIVGNDGLAHYIAPGWVHLKWKPNASATSYFQF